MALATIMVSPAAGPLTDNSDPEIRVTITPPIIPAIKPDINGAPEASAIPRHKGNATKNTAMPDFQSPEMIALILEVIFILII
jgi:hypothetical protein